MSNSILNRIIMILLTSQSRKCDMAKHAVRTLCVLVGTALCGILLFAGTVVLGANHIERTVNDDEGITHADNFNIGHVDNDFTLFAAEGAGGYIIFYEDFSSNSFNGNLTVTTGTAGEAASGGKAGGDIFFGNGDGDQTNMTFNGTGSTFIYTYDGTSADGLTGPGGGAVTFNSVLTYDALSGDFIINAGGHIAFEESVDIGTISNFTGGTEFISRNGNIIVGSTMTRVGGNHIERTTNGVIWHTGDVSIDHGIDNNFYSLFAAEGENGYIRFDEDFSNNSFNGNLTLITGTAGEAASGGKVGGNITFGVDGGGNQTNMTFEGNGNTFIYTYDGTSANGLTGPGDGGVTFFSELDYDGLDGSLVANVGGNIRFMEQADISFRDASNHYDGNLILIARGGSVSAVTNFRLNGGSGDMYVSAVGTSINQQLGSISLPDFEFVAGGGSVFMEAGESITLGNATPTGLNFDFSDLTLYPTGGYGGLALVAGESIRIQSDFNYVDGRTTGGTGPVPIAVDENGNVTTRDTLGGESLVYDTDTGLYYNLYLATQDAGSSITFFGTANLQMNYPQSLIKTPFLHNVGAMYLDNHHNVSFPGDKLDIVTDFWTLQDDLTLNDGGDMLSTWTPNLNSRNMPVLELLGSNTSTNIRNEQITIDYQNSGNLNVFEHVLANDATVSFHQSDVFFNRRNAILRTDLVTVLGQSAFNGDQTGNLSGHIGLVDKETMENATDAGLFVTRIDLGVAGYRSFDGINGIPGYVGSGIRPVVGTLGTPGTAGELYVGDSLYMDGGLIRFKGIRSRVIFNNGYVLGAGGFSAASNPLTANSRIDWHMVDLYGWMDLTDARTVMGAAMYPTAVYTFPTEPLTADQVQNTDYKNIEWFRVDNTGLAADQHITLDDIPGFSDTSARAYNPFPDSPFFNLEIGYLNDEHTSWGLIDFSRRMHTDTMPADLENQAPNSALASMARMIEASPEFDVMNVAWDGPINVNALENILYLSPTRDSYNRSLAMISAGGNLDAVRMVDFSRMHSIFNHSDRRTFLHTCNKKKNGLWFQSHYNELDMDNNFGRGYGGFDVDTWGVTVGWDRRVNNWMRLGMYAGYSDAGLNGWQRNIDSDDYQVGVYAQFLMPRNAILSTGFAYGWQNYDFDRNIHLGQPYPHHGSIGYGERLTGDFDGHSTQFVVELAKNIDFSKRVYLRPAASYAYQYVNLDAYTERSLTNAGGTNSLAQRVGSVSRDHHLFRLGASAGWHTSRLEINARAFWLHNGGDSQSVSSATLTGIASQPFAISGALYDKNQAQLGIGFEFKPMFNVPFSIGVQYDALIGGDNEDNHNSSISLRYEF